MMIVHLDAEPTITAVKGPWRPQNLARVAVRQPVELGIGAGLARFILLGIDTILCRTVFKFVDGVKLPRIVHLIALLKNLL